MVTWEQFSASDSELAHTGARLLFQYGVGLAYLATSGPDGGPRVHPTSPVLSKDHLYVFIVPGSFKKRDLLKDGRYALQAFPPPGLDYLKEGEEFYITGKGELADDNLLRQSVVADAAQHIGEEEVLFELMIERVMHTTWAPEKSGGLQPLRRKWHASRSR